MTFDSKTKQQININIMSKITHTPGPWMANCNYSLSSCLVLDKNNNKIAEVPRYGCAFVNPGEIAPNHLAGQNATLIAAAPELLEALQVMVSTFSQDEKLGIGTVLALQQARAAIAKATGQ